MISRRGFFETMIAVVAGVIGLGLSIPLAGYAIWPALKKREAGWVDLGPIEQLKSGEPKQLEFLATQMDGWLKTTITQWVWAVRHNNEEITVYSPICPHLGCGYHWDSGEGKFACPCHGSIFSIDGKVLAGPAPRPLDTLPVKIEDGRLFVTYEQFKSGTKEKIAI
jgi:menaquinol-cytochrome c reductase iron-sulfur subunit